MIVVVTIAKGNSTKSSVLVFFSDDSNSNGKVNKRIGSVMENYAGCGSSCNSHNIG